MAFSKVLLFAAACLAAGANDFSSLVSSVESELNDLSTQVQAWTAARGLIDALRIQSAVQPLVNNVNNLKTAAQAVSASEVTPSQLQSLTKSIIAVLQSLTAKESDFTRAGARQIVANDIRDLETPTVDIITALISTLKQDCNKLDTLSPLISQISNAFSAAEKAYGGQAAQFPTAPACHRRAVEESAVQSKSALAAASTGPVLNPPLSLAPSAEPPSVSEGPQPVTTTVYACPPSSSSQTPTLSYTPHSELSSKPSNKPSSKPSNKPNTIPSVNNTDLAEVDSGSSGPAGPGLGVPVLITPANLTSQNNTQLIPILSNGAALASVKIGAVAVGIVVAAGIL